MVKRRRMLDELRRRVTSGSGQLDASTRQAAYADDRAALPEPVSGYVEKVHRCAFDITDADVEALRTAGLDDDQIFELTVSAAMGAGLSRLEIATRAMEAS